MSDETNTSASGTQAPAATAATGADIRHDDDIPEAPVPGVTAHGHPSEKQYVMVALGLAVLTAIEVGLYYMTGLPDVALVIALLVLAVVKFVAVVAYFMHLRFDSRIFRRFFVAGLTLAIIVYLIFLSTLHVLD